MDKGNLLGVSFRFEGAGDSFGRAKIKAKNFQILIFSQVKT